MMRKQIVTLAAMFLTATGLWAQIDVHIQTAHFRKYKEGTADMVQSLKLIDTIPLVMVEFVKKAQ